VTSHIFAQTTHIALPTKVVMWGWVPVIVIHAKFHQNPFRGFGSLMGRNLPFSYAWCDGLYNKLGLPPNLWWWLKMASQYQATVEKQEKWQRFISALGTSSFPLPSLTTPIRDEPILGIPMGVMVMGIAKLLSWEWEWLAPQRKSWLRLCSK